MVLPFISKERFVNKMLPRLVVGENLIRTFSCSSVTCTPFMNQRISSQGRWQMYGKMARDPTLCSARTASAGEDTTISIKISNSMTKFNQKVSPLCNMQQSSWYTNGLRACSKRYSISCEGWQTTSSSMLKVEV